MIFFAKHRFEFIASDAASRLEVRYVDIDDRRWITKLSDSIDVFDLDPPSVPAVNWSSAALINCLQLFVLYFDGQSLSALVIQNK